MKQFTVSGVFSSGHYEYDSSMSFIHLNDAAALSPHRRSYGIAA